MVWPCCCRNASDRVQACRTDGASSEMLYSRGTPILRGDEVVREARFEDSNVERIRLRLLGEIFVGSRESCWLTISDLC